MEQCVELAHVLPKDVKALLESSRRAIELCDLLKSFGFIALVFLGVNQALENQFIQGTLAINYFGHGGESGLASERIFDKELADRLYNPGRFPLFITSTCEFSRFDNPDVFTAGEASFANPAGGVIGLLSTTRTPWGNRLPRRNRDV